ncbi:MAG: MBL fold metallo-hydrolase [Candidatus Thiodiazotropha sp. (ex Epidulcina cf. delphinae)]|nr:MBL fold metallo-hydrolase [Candidatus Thiodiazotropha sp. (ex Epidulcina cf. delphinae)]
MPDIPTIGYSHAITCIDTRYQRPAIAACYLLESAGEAVFIDTGTSHTVPHLMAALASRGIPPSQVRYVIPTHVHLDHAGGAGALLQHLPNASLLIHPYGAKHLIDPSKLIAGATAVYGEEKFKADFGDLIAVPEDRVIEAPDGTRVSFGDRELLCLDTPGHARHHICIHDKLSDGIFSGDTFGLSYREFDTDKGPFIMPTTTPIQFDPDAWHLTLDRLMALEPQRIFLTHYGEVTQPAVLAERLHHYLDEFTTIAREADAEPGPDRVAAIRNRLLQWLVQELRQHGCRHSPQTIKQRMSMDLELDAQGLEVWLSRQEEAKATG